MLGLVVATLCVVTAVHGVHVPPKEDDGIDYFLEITENDESEVADEDPRFLKFSHNLSAEKAPEPKLGCDFCLERAQCAKWDEECAVKHPECAEKCGKLTIVPGPSCLTCMEKAGCRQWDVACNNKAPHCHLFCGCGDYHTCTDCTKKTGCSWCAFKNNKGDNMGHCRYAADPAMAKCNAPNFFAKFDFQCLAARRVQDGLPAQPKHPAVEHPHHQAPPSVTSTSFKHVSAKSVKAAVKATSAADHRVSGHPIILHDGPQKRQYNDLVGVNYPPPSLNAKNTLHDKAHFLHKHHKKSAAIAELDRLAKRAERQKKEGMGGIPSYGQN
mmetsp:Transcript_29841/g.58450  ORF Transcript_29841/g.58450 Transcript_29841/m.58450 type:complete len:327 (-) Transcript_29841:409-1389(-)